MGAETETIVINRQNTLNLNNEDKKSTSYDKTDKLYFDEDDRDKLARNERIIEADEEDTTKVTKLLLPSEIGTDHTFKREIVWFNAIGFLILHLVALYGFYIQFTGQVSMYTILYSVFFAHISSLGVTMGAHRLFSHRTYKAKPWLKVVLLALQTTAGQNCLWVWARDHRQHHKYADTDADPHNATRGFFFSHIGWLMSKKHPKVIEYGKKIDMSDLEADYWVMLQKRYYKTLYIIFAIFIPCLIPCLFWNETAFNSFMVIYLARTILQLNLTWCVNSVAHMFGNKPFDKNMLSVESKYVSMFGIGEGWHNYHHSFPWDYRAAELGSPYNLTTKVIDFFAKYGQVYDRKSVSVAMMKSRILRTGDGSHHMFGVDAYYPIEEENSLRKYIVDKKDGGSKLLMDQLEKEIKFDHFNNNANADVKSNMKKDFNLNENILKSTKASLNMVS